MTSRLAVAVLALMAPVCATGFAPAPLPRRSMEKDENLSAARLAGDWKVLGLWRYGPNGSISYRIEAWKFIRIENGRWSFCQFDNNSVKPSTTYEIDINGRQPAQIDFRRPGEQKVWMIGIARFKGDNLEVLYMPHGTARPTSFDNPPENFYLFTLTKSR